MKKDIFIILPFKESLNPNNAGAVSLYVKDTTSHSKFKKRISIISSDNFRKIGRAHVRTPVTSLSRMPSSA